MKFHHMLLQNVFCTVLIEMNFGKGKKSPMLKSMTNCQMHMMLNGTLYTSDGSMHVKLPFLWFYFICLEANLLSVVLTECNAHRIVLSIRVHVLPPRTRSTFTIIQTLLSLTICY